MVLYKCGALSLFSVFSRAQRLCHDFCAGEEELKVTYLNDREKIIKSLTFVYQKSIQLQGLIMIEDNNSSIGHYTHRFPRDVISVGGANTSLSLG